MGLKPSSGRLQAHCKSWLELVDSGQSKAATAKDGEGWRCRKYEANVADAVDTAIRSTTSNLIQKQAETSNNIMPQALIGE